MYVTEDNDDVNWSPRNYNLTSLDHFLWKAVKDQCYANNSETIRDLKTKIHAPIAEIRLITKDQRIGLIEWLSHGGHLNKTICHKYIYSKIKFLF